MKQILLITLIFFCYSCSDNSGISQATSANKVVEYKDLKMERGRKYSEIKILDRKGVGKPQERTLKLDRITNDPVSPAMHELVRSGLKYSGKNIRLDKVERDGDQWEIYFTSNKNPPKNLGKDGNFMVVKTLNYYIDNYNLFLDGDTLYTTNRRPISEKEREAILRAEEKKVMEDITKDIDKHNH